MLMDHSEFRIILAFVLLSFIFHRGYYSKKVQHATATVLAQPKLGRISLLASLFALPAVLATIVYVFMPAWISWFSLPLPLWTRWLGVVITLAGFVLLQWSQQALGKNWSDAPVLLKGQDLITHGPYQFIRHPIYAAFFLIFGSLFLISANLLVGIFWLGMIGLDIIARINLEEKMMIDLFGEQYQSYIRRTGCIYGMSDKLIGAMGN